MKRVVFFLVFFGGLLLHPTLVSAHAGPGPPFLRMNGKFAQTNTYFQGEGAINVPQDLGPEKYLVNQMIAFEVDTSQLLVPPDIAQNTQFRWTLITGNTFMDTQHPSVQGRQFQRTFSHVGSYLLQLEAEGPGEYTYNIIDTVQVDVVPNTSYKTPKLSIDIGAPDGKNNFQSTFVGKAVIDPTAKQSSYLWDLGDKTLLTGISQMKDYRSSSPISYLYARVIDSNGLIADVGFDVWRNDTGLDYHPFGNMLQAPITVKKAAEVAKESRKSENSSGFHVPGVILDGVILLVLLFGFMLIRPKRVS